MIDDLPPEVIALVMQWVLRERFAMDVLGALASTNKVLRDAVRGVVRRVAVPNESWWEADSPENVTVHIYIGSG
jgi:hypothetical protein